MNLIHFQGLHCFHDCVITIAAYFGVNFAHAFGRLWSETDFRFDPYREAYLTKRLICDLELLGAKVECVDCFSVSQAEKIYALCRENEPVILGVDSYYIPWNQSYKTFHGPHYIIAQKSSGERLSVFDPTFGIDDRELPRDMILENTFDFGRVIQVPDNSISVSITNEAREFLAISNNFREDILQQIRECKEQPPEQIIYFAKYIDALISNRFLYKYLLSSVLPESSRSGHLFFQPEYFSKWVAVKNGLYKAAVLKERESVISELRECFKAVIDDEIELARGFVVNIG